MILTIIVVILAAGLFLPLFIFGNNPGVDFWWWMTANITILLLIAGFFDKSWRKSIAEDLRDDLIKKIVLGVGSAILLYGGFLIGDQLAQLIFPFAKDGIEGVYSFKSTASPIRIGILMLVIIGPGEELFWRGFIQRRLQNDTNPWGGFILATIIYSAIHIASGNIMLVMAAAVCGVFWGYLYLRYNSILINVVSHTIWDILIFLILPIQ